MISVGMSGTEKIIMQPVDMRVFVYYQFSILTFAFFFMKAESL